ncbi:efflux RND transporter periplasmic adaptor subunit [Muribaculum intestinale]|uniref:efflux RND transporter periplasmic adaptor subunit n=2 Tax=Muribaculum intestinale TaxID=1796646 RepID=UPI0025B5679E|nr:HlyD family efflux transporter periplasmic adaptor subunit [Muribaculum intestinale]
MKTNQAMIPTNIHYCRSVLTLAATFVFSGLISCTGHDNHAESESEEHEHSSEEIILSPHSAHRFGVKVEQVADCKLPRIVRAWGALEAVPGTGRQILSSRSAGIVRLSSRAVAGASLRPGERVATVSGKGIAGGDANAVASEELAAAQKELERIEPLRNEGIVSERDYQSALSTVKRLSAAYSGNGSGSAVTASQKATIIKVNVADGEWVEAGTPVVETSTDSRLLLRVDLPLSMRNVAGMIVDANFATADSPDNVKSVSMLGGSIIEDTKGTAATNGNYMPIYFSIPNDGSLSQGVYTDIWVILEDDNDVTGSTIPVEAVVESEGEYFAYVKVDDHGYEKRRLSLGVTDGKIVEVKAGLVPSDSVVTNGAMILKMAENSGKIPEGHSHNH